MSSQISFVLKPNNRLKNEIRPFEPDSEYKKDFHKSLRIVVMESEKVGKLYTDKTTGLLNFKIYLN